jgi:hypothetical protein
MRLIPKNLVALALVGYSVTAVAMAGEIDCDSPFKGRTPAPEELVTVLRNHEVWLESGAKSDDTRRANLCRADLQRANLQGATLDRVNLQEARLDGANLQGATLNGADLQQANLLEADLRQADLSNANLQGTVLGEAKLQEVNLWKANLQGAFLNGANLQQAHLREANLQEANLGGANLQEGNLWGANLPGAFLGGATLTRVIYEPNPESLPRILDFAERPTRLEEMIFVHSPAALMTLREAFKKAGMRAQERQLTYAIEHTRRHQAWNPSWPLPREDKRPWLEQFWGKLESGFKWLAFEESSHYGMSYGRPMKILAVSIVWFSLVYMIALFTARGRAGIWATWPADRVYHEEGSKEATRVTNTFFFPRWQEWAAGRWWGVLLRGLCIPLIGLYFGLLSAFFLGWRELNVGTWISRMQPREYILRATGWVRFFTGLQSVVSVYLLALWALTYFGRPFE